MTHRSNAVAALTLIAGAALLTLAAPGCFFRSYDSTQENLGAAGRGPDAEDEGEIALTTDMAGAETTGSPPSRETHATAAATITTATAAAPTASPVERNSATARATTAANPVVTAIATNGGVLTATTVLTEDMLLDRIWVSPSYDERKYSAIFIAPVDTRQIAQLKPIQQVNPVAFDQSHGALQAAAYAQRSLKNAVEQSPSHKYKIVDRPGPHTLVVQMAITALAPNRIGVGAADYAGPVLGDPAALTATKLPGRGWIEMQAEFRDGTSGEVMAVLSDARAPDVPVATPALLKPYAFTDAIIDLWSRAIVIVATNPATPRIIESYMLRR
jgi:hypothetical protein